MSGFYCNKKVKQYAISPGGKALYNDSTRFGTKMLEKMGWTKGKGLGANLDGDLNFVRISHKDDNKGMGFHDRDDQWTQHEQNFNALLKSFETKDDGEEAAEAADDGDDIPSCVGFGFQAAKKTATPAAVELVTKEKVFSGVSLEEQSKKSTKRVHYKKFTRGKDMARYSEQDLANIFGKKALNDQHTFVPAQPMFVASDDDDEEQEEKEEEKKEEHIFGVTVIKTGTSITDYFKEKMEALRLKRQGPNGEGASNPFYVYNPQKVTLDFPKEAEEEHSNGAQAPIDVSHQATEETGTSNGQKKSKKSKKRNTERDEKAADVEHTTARVEESVELVESEEAPKKKKKSKKSKRSEEDEAPAATELDTSIDQIDFVVSKKTTLDNVNDENVEIPNIASPERPEKQKKKKKLKLEAVVAEEATSIVSSEKLEKRKKKRKHEAAADLEEEKPRAVLAEEATNVPQVDAEIVPVKKSKKSKKLRNADEDTENASVTVQTEETGDVSEAPPKKKKKKSKAGAEVITQPLHFPKFISNVLTSLYDPNNPDELADRQPEENASSASPPPATTPTPPTTTISAVTSTALQDTFELAKYKAEVFRFFDLSGFAGSNLCDIAGYGFSRNLQLKVITMQRDDQRITNFWDQALVNKYGADAVKIKREAKFKKFNIKKLEKRNVFKM